MPEATYSVIIPVFNEERNIRPMYEKLLDAMPDAGFEVIFVDEALVIPLVNLAAIGTYYKHFSNTGNAAVRGQVAQGYYLRHVLQVLHRIARLLGAGQWQMLENGVVKGLQVIAADRAYLYLVLAVLIAVLLGVLDAREKPAPGYRENIVIFLLGVSLLVIPFTPFFILSYTLIANRNAFLSLLGVALIIGVFFRLVFRGRARVLQGILLAALVFAFLLANTAEVSDYRSVSLMDREICRSFIKTADEAGPDWDHRDILLFNARPVYVNLTAEHFQNCTSSDWAFMGAVQVTRHQPEIGYILPVPGGGQFSLSEDRLMGAMYVGMDDQGGTFLLSGGWSDHNTLVLTTGSGEIFGEVARGPDGLFQFRKFIAAPCMMITAGLRSSPSKNAPCRTTRSLVSTATKSASNSIPPGSISPGIHYSLCCQLGATVPSPILPGREWMTGRGISLKQCCILKLFKERQERSGKRNKSEVDRDHAGGAWHEPELAENPDHHRG